MVTVAMGYCAVHILVTLSSALLNKTNGSKGRARAAGLPDKAIDNIAANHVLLTYGFSVTGKKLQQMRRPELSLANNC